MTSKKRNKNHLKFVAVEFEKADLNIIKKENSNVTTKEEINSICYELDSIIR